MILVVIPPAIKENMMMSTIDQPKQWEFSKGKLALDFANTVYWHASDEPEETIESFAEFLDWAKAASLLKGDEYRLLNLHSKERPMECEHTLHNALELRECIYRIFSALARDLEPDPQDIDQVKEIMAEGLSHARIVHAGGNFSWTWDEGRNLPQRILWRIAQSAVELLLSNDLNRVGQCEDDRGCGWLFFDTSRNRARRWCSMESCGNRAKAQRFYQRQAQTKLDNSPS